MTELDQIAAEYPDKDIYFTEASIGAWNYTFENCLVGDFQSIFYGTLSRGGKGVTLWNLMLDNDGGPYSPADGIEYNYYTTLKGVMEKEDPENPTEFTVPERLKELYAARDFGRYADSRGQMPVAFLSNLDITGGNSGSPVLNSRGELIGLAFDGNWEAMSGDIAFEPELQRCIGVDVRYVLFIIDKFAGASWLLDEMEIVGGAK